MVFQVVACLLPSLCRTIVAAVLREGSHRPRIAGPKRCSRKENFYWEINMCASLFLSMFHLWGPSTPASLSQPLLWQLPIAVPITPLTSDSFHCGSQTNLVRTWKAVVLWRLFQGVVGPQLSDRKPREIIQARGLSRAGGRVALSCLESEGRWQPGTSRE